MRTIENREFLQRQVKRETKKLFFKLIRKIASYSITEFEDFVFVSLCMILWKILGKHWKSLKPLVQLENSCRINCQCQYILKYNHDGEQFVRDNFQTMGFQCVKIKQYNTVVRVYEYTTRRDKTRQYKTATELVLHVHLYSNEISISMRKWAT